MQNLVIKQHLRNKITLTKEETRLKLNGTNDARLIKFAKKIDSYLREKQLIYGTLRGAFDIDKVVYVDLRSNNRYIIFSFSEGKEEPIVTDHLENYILNSYKDIL